MIEYIFQPVVTDDKLNVIHQSKSVQQSFLKYPSVEKNVIRLCQDVIFERELFLFAEPGPVLGGRRQARLG